MNLIAAVDRNWGIGKQNKLLVRIPSDMKFFQNETMGKVVVMGRKTFESFSGGLPLKGRTNLILSQNPDYQVKHATVVHSLAELLEKLKAYPDDQIYVIGGGQIFSLLLPYCNLAHVTKINYSFSADTYFPNLDRDEAWEITAASEEQTYFNLEFSFVKYERKRNL